MYTFVVVTFALLAGVFVYILYLKQKAKRLDKIERGFCPQCHQQSIEVKSSHSSGCSGTKSVLYRCSNCGDEEEFNQFSGCVFGCNR